MTEISDRYRRNAAAFTDRVAAVPADRWSSPSPCAEWDARDVVRHAVDVQHLFLNFVGRDVEQATSVDDDPLAAWAEARDLMAAALDDPEVAGLEYDGMFGRAVFEQSVDQFASSDLVVHAWDLARATGGDERIDPGEIERIRTALEPMADKMRGPGAFGPEVEPQPGADEQERFLAFLGRVPRP